jgi:hypothetical protein
MRRCCQCRIEKPLEDFHIAATRWGGYGSRCKPCAIAAARDWYFANKDRKRAYDEKRRITHRHLYNEASLRYWKAHPDVVQVRTNARRSRLRKAKPPWMSSTSMEHFYTEARKISAETKSKWEVDHIVPLLGKNVCGLHVPWNLQIIPSFENRMKNNRFLFSPDGIHK